MGRARLNGLDALRGIAALMVLGYHATMFYAPSFTLFSRAYLAVDFFFLLSGFVLARTYEHRMPTASKFVITRYRRLAIPIAFGMLIGACYVLGRGWPAWIVGLDLFTGLAFLPTVGWLWPLNRPAWSIYFEVCANAAHAAVFARVQSRWLLVLVVVCAAILAAHPDLKVGQEETFALGFPRVFMSYTLGILLWRHNGDNGRLPAWFGYVGLPASLLLFSLLSGRADLAFAIIVSPLVLLAGLSGTSRIGIGLGALSFPLYATHWPVLDFAFHLGATPFVASAVCLAVAALVTAVSDRRLGLARSSRAATETQSPDTVSDATKSPRPRPTN